MITAQIELSAAKDHGHDMEAAADLPERSYVELVHEHQQKGQNDQPNP
jgi:hypothetical protein